MIKEELLSLADAYRQAGDAIYDTIRDSIRRAGGFLPCINNDRSRQDMFVQVYDSRKKYSESFPIRAMKLDARGELLVYIGTVGTLYTERYLRGPLSEEHWAPLKGSNILFHQTILSIAAAIDEYL
ncbi:MAG: hypothetical protein J5951_05845 [Bacteroidales bacterium]|nr:hypothetical protein [Bacteroidales bacterium]